ncbi:MAG: hypothetical protein K9L64_04975 [Candidatus Izimaplasma sp.]|nr:hypothetical protein [Candidatus Izimaplasma bacterium]
MTNNKLEINAIYDEMQNFIISSGIQEKNVSRENNTNSVESIIVECHSLLTIIMYYDREWTIDYFSGKIATHNHIFDIKDDFIKDLFEGDLFFLINNRFFHRISAFPDLKFVSKDNIDKILHKYKSKNKIKLFSVKEILIDN